MEQNVLRYLTSNENSITELLRALCVHKPIRKVIIDLFTQGKIDPNDVEFESISTQTKIDSAIPDMLILGADLRVIAEIKVSDWCSLTDNQPISYLNWLVKEDAKNKFFVFVVPSNYFHIQEYNNRKMDFCAKNRDHGIIFTEISWMDICSAIVEAGLTSICTYCHDFVNLFQEDHINFSVQELQETDMFTKEAATAISKIMNFVDSIAIEIERAGFSVKRNFNKRWWEGEHGIYIEYQNNEVLFLGLWYKFWEDHACPLCIAVDCNRYVPSVINLFREHNPNSIHYPPNGRYPYWTQCIDKVLLTNDSVQKVTKWLLDDNGYLKQVANIL